MSSKTLDETKSTCHLTYDLASLYLWLRHAAVAYFAKLPLWLQTKAGTEAFSIAETLVSFSRGLAFAAPSARSNASILRQP